MHAVRRCRVRRVGRFWRATSRRAACTSALSGCRRRVCCCSRPRKPRPASGADMPRIRAAPDEVHTPFFPGEKEENWWVLLADVSSNALLAVQKARRAQRLRCVSRASRLTRCCGLQVSLSSKGKGLTKFRAAAAKAPAPGSAAGSTATPRPGGEPASAAGTVSAAKVRAVCGMLQSPRCADACTLSVAGGWRPRADAQVPSAAGGAAPAAGARWAPCVVAREVFLTGRLLAR